MAKAKKSSKPVVGKKTALRRKAPPVVRKAAVAKKTQVEAKIGKRHEPLKAVELAVPKVRKQNRVVSYSPDGVLLSKNVKVSPEGIVTLRG